MSQLIVIVLLIALAFTAGVALGCYLTAVSVSLLLEAQERQAED